MASSDQTPDQERLKQLQRQLIILKQKKEVITKGITGTEASIAQLEVELGFRGLLSPSVCPDRDRDEI